MHDAHTLEKNNYTRERQLAKVRDIGQENKLAPPASEDVKVHRQPDV
jgi:hypothetical protein